MWSLYFSMDTGINGHTTAPPTGIYQEMIHYRRVPRSFAGAQDDGCPAGIPDPRSRSPIPAAPRLRALPQPSAAEPLSNLRTLGAIAPSNFRTLTPAGCQSSCWWEQGFPLSHIPRKKAKHDASPFYFLYCHPFFCYSSLLPYILSDFHASLLLY